MLRSKLRLAAWQYERITRGLAVLGGTDHPLEEMLVPNATVALVTGAAAVLTEANNARDWAHAPPEAFDLKAPCLIEPPEDGLFFAVVFAPGARFAADEAYRENLRQARAEALSKATIERQKREAIEDRKREKELVKALGDGSRNWRPDASSRFGSKPDTHAFLPKTKKPAD